MSMRRTCVYTMEKNKDNTVNVLYRSNNFLVVNKPYDLVINSNNPELKTTLQKEVQAIFPELVNPELRHEFHFVHRLDYATSGVICLALNKYAAKAATNAFEKRKAKKYYLALVHGHINKRHVIISEPIGDDVREKNGNHKMCTGGSAFCERPRNSYTALLVLERGTRNGKPATKVLLCPKTGRRHQLRVHCSHIGHTIIGDYTYSERQDTEPHRTFLHSYRLILQNQVENLDVIAPDPFESSEPVNQWVPTNSLQVLNDSAFTAIDKLTLNLC
ncbi:RNA pseudouridylate synthase domain-containing protein 1-like isoform X2 [Athalia rosae]|uniref:RNA pseudouridylate synthase domain-containing protein 1-like isoform X2 n=1 Tax=Athalia rosae TaxID=37344 RepID=UPI0020349F9E|nr:RNA pseudouridylate synthase domain-containing protein 1-like isoform X2 [Athalia rosae]